MYKRVGVLKMLPGFLSWIEEGKVVRLCWMWGVGLAEFGGCGGCGISLSKHHRWNGMEEINTGWLAGCGMYIVT